MTAQHKMQGVEHRIGLLCGRQYRRHCRHAIAEGLLEPPQMPLEETLYIMELMDGLRKKWGVHYPMDKKMLSL